MRVSLEKTEVTDMRKITVTEDNFEKVLEKLRKMCDKYKMLEFYRALSEDLTEVKCKTNSMGLRSELDKEWRDKNGEYKYKVKKKFFMYSKYVCVTKHPFRRDYETDKESYNAKYMYPKMRSEEHTSELQSQRDISYAVFCFSRYSNSASHVLPSVFADFKVSISSR